MDQVYLFLFSFFHVFLLVVVVVTDKALSMGQEIFGHIFLAHSWGSGKVSLILFTQQFGNIILFFSNLPMLALFLHCKDPLFISKQNVALKKRQVHYIKKIDILSMFTKFVGLLKHTYHRYLIIF